MLSLLNKYILPSFLSIYYLGTLPTLFIISLTNLFFNKSSMTFIFFLITIYLNIFGLGNFIATLLLLLLSLFIYFFNTIKNHYFNIRNTVKMCIQFGKEFTPKEEKKKNKTEIDDLLYINNLFDYFETKIYSICKMFILINNKINNYDEKLNLSHKIDNLSNIFTMIILNITDYFTNIFVWFMEEFGEFKYINKINDKFDSLKTVYKSTNIVISSKKDKDISSNDFSEKILNMEKNIMNNENTKLLEKEMENMFNSGNMDFNLLNNKLFGDTFGELNKLLTSFQKDIDNGNNFVMTDNMVDEDIEKIIDTVKSTKNNKKKKRNKKK